MAKNNNEHLMPTNVTATGYLGELATVPALAVPEYPPEYEPQYVVVQTEEN